MNENFERFKRAERSHAALFSGAVGLGAGALTSAVILILAKLYPAIDALIALVGVGVGAIVFAALFFILKSTDAALAKKLDSGFSLGERVATSIEFTGQDGVVLELQREDTERRLGEISTPRLLTKKLIAALVALAVTLGALTFAIVFPDKTQQEESESPIDAFDKDWIIASINELITMIEDVYMDESLKATALTELRGLLDFVEGSELLSEMKSKAILTVKAINSSLRNVNSAFVIGESASQSYVEEINELAEALCELSATSVKKALTAISSSLEGANEDDIMHVADELNALINASGVRIDDPVVVLFKALANATVEAAPTSASLADEYSEAADQLSLILMVQSVNDTIVRRVTDKLCELFGIVQSDLLTPEGDVEVDLGRPGTQAPDDGEGDEGEEEDDEDDVISGGGLGSGGVQYGSDDVIYDPKTGTYKPYGEILRLYHDIFLQQKIDGTISPELSERLDDYFDLLYGSGSSSGND